MSSQPRSTPSRAGDDGGGAVVEFVLVATLLLVVAAGVFQIALTLHVRNILLSSASEGAHVGALADASPRDGAERARAMAQESLGGREVHASARETGSAGNATVEVTLTAAVPVLGLFGVGAITVTAHAPEESDA